MPTANKIEDYLQIMNLLSVFFYINLVFIKVNLNKSTCKRGLSIPTQQSF